jgi:periplasmic protein CpxP/Spy
MKKVVVLLLAVGSTFALQAQVTQEPKKQAHREERRKEMNEKLNLSEAQKADVKKIHEEQKTKREAISNNASLSREEKQAAMKNLKKDGAKRMDGVLNEEQKKVVKEERKEFRKRDGRKPHRRHSAIGR